MAWRQRCVAVLVGGCLCVCVCGLLPGCAGRWTQLTCRRLTRVVFGVRGGGAAVFLNVPRVCVFSTEDVRPIPGQCVRTIRMHKVCLFLELAGFGCTGGDLLLCGQAQKGVWQAGGAGTAGGWSCAPSKVACRLQGWSSVWLVAERVCVYSSVQCVGPGSSGEKVCIDPCAVRTGF